MLTSLTKKSWGRVIHSDFWMPLGLVVASFVFYLWLSWHRVPGIIGDQGWFLQVSRRVAGGELLYRDVLWSYGPLPIYIMSALMRLGNFDIAFYAIFHASCAAIASIILYHLHRYQLSPRAASIGAILIMTIGGSYVPFLLNYSAAGALGALCMLITFWGLIGCVKKPLRWRYSVAVVIGLAGALSSKQEYAFGAFMIGLFALIVSLRVSPASLAPETVVRVIFASWVSGILLAATIYGLLGIQMGWQPILEGLSGYQIITVAKASLMIYSGKSSWLHIIAASVSTLIIIAYFIIFSRRSTSMHKKLTLALGLFTLLGYWLVLLAWRTGWLSDVRHQNISPLDVMVLINRINFGNRGLHSFFQVHLGKILLLGMVLVLLMLAPKWIKRWRQKELVPFEQMACLLALAFAILIDLRYALFATSFLPPTMAVFVLMMLPSEFPWLRSYLKPSIFGTIPLIGAGIAFFVINLLSIAVPYVFIINQPYDTVYGQIYLDPMGRSLINESIQYIKQNSAPQDSISAIGPLPGLYYLSERRNPFRQDYLSIFVGNSESDMPDYLDRMERFTPSILLVPQGEQNYGILNLRGSSEEAGSVRVVGRRLFGDAAPQVEAYLLEHYQFDRFLNENGYIEFAAFKRIK